MCTYTCIYIYIYVYQIVHIQVYIYTLPNTDIDVEQNGMCDAFLHHVYIYIYIQRITQHVFESKDLGRESKPREHTYMHVKAHSLTFNEYSLMRRTNSKNTVIDEMYI